MASGQWLAIAEKPKSSHARAQSRQDGKSKQRVLAGDNLRSVQGKFLRLGVSLCVKSFNS